MVWSKLVKARSAINYYTAEMKLNLERVGVKIYASAPSEASELCRHSHSSQSLTSLICLMVSRINSRELPGIFLRLRLD